MTTTPAKPANPNDAKSTLSLGKPSLDPKGAQEARVSLKAICTELKVDPRIAREKLRLAIRDAKKFPELAKTHKPKSAWEWTNGSPAEKEARAALST